FIVALGLHTEEEMESPGFARYWSERPPSYTLIRDPMLRLCHRMMAHSIIERSQAPEKVTVTNLFYLRGLDVGSVNIPYLLTRYLRRFAVGRKSGALIFGGQFVALLAEHFGLLTEERLWGLTVIMRELPVIDMAELVRLQICIEIDDTWAWVALGPARQPDATAGAPEAAEDAPVADEGDQAVPAPVQAPQQPLPPPPAAGRTMPQRLGRLEEELMEASGQTYQSFDGTFQGNSPAAFQRRTRIKIGSKFITIVREYVTKTLSKPRAEWRRESDFKCVEAEEKSNLKTSL
ncbi:hypothetical protein Tco_0935954, partial [Tanacetum coccineum]